MHAGAEAVGFFEEREKYDQHMTMRAPSSLAERVNRIAKAEGTSGNEVKVTLMRTGATVYDWVARHQARFEAACRSEKLTPDEMIVKLLEAGAAALERSGKR